MGSNPTSATEGFSFVSWSNGTIPGSHPGDDGSTPSGTTLLRAKERNGPQVLLAARLLGTEVVRVRSSGGPWRRDEWAAGPMAKDALACNQETGVRLPGGPLGDDGFNHGR